MELYRNNSKSLSRLFNKVTTPAGREYIGHHKNAYRQIDRLSALYKQEADLNNIKRTPPRCRTDNPPPRRKKENPAASLPPGDSIVASAPEREAPEESVPETTGAGTPSRQFEDFLQQLEKAGF